MVFGSTSALKSRYCTDEISNLYPRAHIIGCSTAGEIFDTQVSNDCLVVTAIHFEHTQLKEAVASIDAPGDSASVGARLAQSLDRIGLKHVFVLSEGLNVNGSELVRGLTEHLPDDITVTGGLAGDGERFAETYVLWNGKLEQNLIGVVGFYGDAFKVGSGSLGGWDPFGPERLITRSTSNVLYELDGTSALELYKRYLGEHADGLPATGLLFPLSLRTRAEDTPVVRTILSVDENEQSLTFAGDIPQGSYARLMKANFDRLIDGAAGAAKTTYGINESTPPDLAILISCVGRKMVLRQRIEEEVEAVRDVLGETPILTGFYSYGEISPFTPNARCELHNQTMTITTMSEN
jgi:hypothetical protein